MKKFILIAALIAPFTSQAYCLNEYYTKLSETEKSKGRCELTKPLRLAWTYKVFPKLRENPRRVQYWEGQYAKTDVIEVRYLRELVNDCRGIMISQQTLLSQENRTRVFDLRNPNLDISVNESFMLLPMTEVEAKLQLVEVEKLCQK